MSSKKLVPALRFSEFKECSNWTENTLEEFLEISATYGIVKAGDFQTSGIPMVRGGDIKNGTVNSQLPLVSEAIHNQYKRTILRSNDVVISLVGYPGEAAVIPKSLVGANISRAVGLIRLRDGINSLFLVSFLNSPVGRGVVLKPSAGSAQTVVNLNSLNKLLIPRPSPEEQQKIADCLSSLDDIITFQTQKLNFLKTHKKGLMQDLFPADGESVPRLRFKGFEDDWGKENLENLSSKISDGIHSTPVYDDNGQYFFINGNNLVNASIIIDEKTKRVSKTEYDRHKKILGLNTILLSINGTIGNISFFNDERVILGKSTCYINIKEDRIIKHFAFYFLQLEKVNQYYNLVLTGSTIKNLSLKSIKNISVDLPELIEQQKIANCLSSLDEQIQAQTQKIKSLKLHKKGLMQQLFPNTNDQ